MTQEQSPTAPTAATIATMPATAAFTPNPPIATTAAASAGNMIGDKEIVLNQSFVCRTGETVKFTVHEGTAPLLIVLRFLEDEAGQGAGQGAPQASWSAEGNKLKMEFRGWNNNLTAAALVKPARIGMLSGRTVGFNLAHMKIGEDIHWVTFILFLGGEYD